MASNPSPPAELPLISIVTPSYQQAAYLEAAMLSVLRQDYPRIQYIVIDGGSTDGSLEIIQRYSGQIDYWISEPDSGQAAAINKGLAAAKGEIVAWLNSDDLLMAGTVQAAVERLLRSPELSLVYGDGVVIDGADRVLDFHSYRQLGLLELLCFQVILQPTVFMRRSALEAVGGLREQFQLILDHDLWVRLAAQGELAHVPQTWAAERSYPQAKTMAAAAEFADEARSLVDWAMQAKATRETAAAHRARIEASLATFAGKRLIDSGRYRDALGQFIRGLGTDPLVPLAQWYKLLQAGLGAAGLERLFLWYRRTRRRVQHRGLKLVMGADGPVIESQQAEATGNG